MYEYTFCLLSGGYDTRTVYANSVNEAWFIARLDREFWYISNTSLRY